MYRASVSTPPSPFEGRALTDRHNAPSAVRYIKLGLGGAWAPKAITEHIVPVGFSQVEHTPCAAADWGEVRRQLAVAGRTPTGVSQGERELRDFYELDDDTLWVTFADGHLYWTFADQEVVPVAKPDPSGPHRYRRSIGGWSRTSLTGDDLAVRALSSSLTRVAGFRQTICRVEREAYLLRRIKGEDEPLLIEARRLGGEMEKLAAAMIAALDWRDFEIMVDLIFARGGWQRQSALGDGEVDIDLLLDNPSTGESAWVQVKSSASQATLDDYLNRFRRDGSAEHFYFTVHSPKGPLTLPTERGLHLWAGEHLARATIAAGLFDWLIERTR